MLPLVSSSPFEANSNDSPGLENASPQTSAVVVAADQSNSTAASVENPVNAFQTILEQMAVTSDMGMTPLMTEGTHLPSEGKELQGLFSKHEIDQSILNQAMPILPGIDRVDALDLTAEGAECGVDNSCEWFEEAIESSETLAVSSPAVPLDPSTMVMIAQQHQPHSKKLEAISQSALSNMPLIGEEQGTVHAVITEHTLALTAGTSSDQFSFKSEESNFTTVVNFGLQHEKQAKHITDSLDLVFTQMDKGQQDSGGYVEINTIDAKDVVSALGSPATDTRYPKPVPQVVTLPIATPLYKPEWMDQFNGQIRWMVDQQVSSAQVTIDPPELGPIQVDIARLADNSTQMIFTVNNQSVKELFESNIARFKSMLMTDQNQSVQVDVRQQNHKQQDHEQWKSTDWDRLNTASSQSKTTYSANFLVRPRALLDHYV